MLISSYLNNKMRKSHPLFPLIYKCWGLLGLHLNALLHDTFSAFSIKLSSITQGHHPQLSQNHLE